MTAYDALRTTAALLGFERWYATEHQYIGGWLITRGAPWEPGHPERILATVRNGETARQIVADHNGPAPRAAEVGEAQLSFLGGES